MDVSNLPGPVLELITVISSFDNRSLRLKKISKMRKSVRKTLLHNRFLWAVEIFRGYALCEIFMMEAW